MSPAQSPFFDVSALLLGFSLEQYSNHSECCGGFNCLAGTLFFLPSLLFLSPTSSSGLMTLRFVAAGATGDFSPRVLFSTHALSPRISVSIVSFPK
jgi:hypothetical protein